MNEKEYHAYPALNSTALMRFQDCPAAVLLPREPTGYFRMGHLFEELARETWTGPAGFWDRYFVAALAGDMPERLVLAIDNGEDLQNAYVLKKDGTRNDQQNNFHFWLDECNRNPGKIPISQDEYKQLRAMVHNLGMAPAFPGITVADLAKDAEWQVPHIWTTDNGIENKCLFDIVTTLDSGHKVIVDLKAFASLGKFKNDYINRYWVQDRHYSAGAYSLFGEDCYQDTMIFAVASKEEPYKAKCFEAARETVLAQDAAYHQLCNQFVQWQSDGKPAIAWEDKETITFWRP